MKFQIIKADPFKAEVAVFRSVKQYRKHFERHGYTVEPSGVGDAFAFRDMFDGAAYFSMVLPKGVDAPMIAHECVHVADYVMEHVGVPTGVKNTEVRAYLTEHLMRQIMEKRAV